MGLGWIDRLIRKEDIVSFFLIYKEGVIFRKLKMIYSPMYVEHRTKRHVLHEADANDLPRVSSLPRDARNIRRSNLGAGSGLWI